MTAKTILITGGGGGIGSAIAKLSVSLGHNCLLVGRQLAPLEVVKAINPKQIDIISADISKEEDIHNIKQRLKDVTGLTLVQNAAVIEPLGQLLDVAKSDFQTMLDINVTAPLMLTKALRDNLIGGRVLHLSSEAAHVPYQGINAYCISKAAFHMMYLALKEELSPEMCIGSIKPGMVDTPMLEKLTTYKIKENIEADFYQSLKESHMVSPDVVGHFCAWLLFDLDDKDFSETEWDIYDESHHHLWLNDLPKPKVPEAS